MGFEDSDFAFFWLSCRPQSELGRSLDDWLTLVIPSTSA